MKKLPSKHYARVLIKTDGSKGITKQQKDLVLARIKDIKANSERLLNWTEVSSWLTSKKFDAKKFCGVLQIDEDPLLIQKRLTEEWN